MDAPQSGERRAAAVSTVSAAAVAAAAAVTAAVAAAAAAAARSDAALLTRAVARRDAPATTPPAGCGQRRGCWAADPPPLQLHATRLQTPRRPQRQQQVQLTHMQTCWRRGQTQPASREMATRRSSHRSSSTVAMTIPRRGVTVGSRWLHRPTHRRHCEAQTCCCERPATSPWATGRAATPAPTQATCCCRCRRRRAPPSARRAAGRRGAGAAASRSLATCLTSASGSGTPGCEEPSRGCAAPAGGSCGLPGLEKDSVADVGCVH